MIPFSVTLPIYIKNSRISVAFHLSNSERSQGFLEKLPWNIFFKNKQSFIYYIFLSIRNSKSRITFVPG